VPLRLNFWIHEDILHEQRVLKTTPALKDTQGGPAYAGFALGMLLDYWRAVEQSTLTYLAALTVDGLLWHVMIHQVRHTGQIAVLLRTQGVKPPSLDLLFYLDPSQVSEVTSSA
jgi:hypothetical protein